MSNGQYSAFLLLRSLLQSPLEALYATTASIDLLLSGVDRVTHTAGFNAHGRNRARNQVDRATHRARRGGVFVNLWVDTFFHRTGEL